MNDRQTPKYIIQRAKIEEMGLEQCEAAWHWAQSKRGKPTDCGRFTSYPINESGYQAMLSERIAFLENQAKWSKPLTQINHWD